MNKKHRGAAAELQAATWLLAQGYEVFRNVSQHGPADLMAWNPQTNECFPVDVKTIGRYRSGNKIYEPYPKLTPEQVARGIRLIAVFDDGQVLMTDGRTAQYKL
jgi:Holliday junction resolvase-like predicted endonuclease